MKQFLNSDGKTYNGVTWNEQFVNWFGRKVLGIERIL